MAAKEAERVRFQANLTRLDRLCAGPTAAERAAAAQSLNFGDYKEGVLQLAATHRTDLALHEADMAVTKVALNAAALRHELLGQVLATEQQRLHRAGAQREQKQQDEQASQLWLRGTLP